MDKNTKLACYKWLLIYKLLFILFSLVFLVYMHLWTTNNNIEINTCLFYHQTKLLCPACGGTRAINHLINGAFLDAIRCNALLLTVVLCTPITLSFIVKTRNIGFSSTLLFEHIRFCTAALFLLTIIFWILRNIPALEFLRPV